VQRVWASTGALAVVLFGCGLLFGDLLGSSNYPQLNAPHGEVQAYFLQNGSEVRALAFFHVLSALALLCFAAYLRAWLKQADEPAGRLAAVAPASGATSAAFLLLSALIYRTLAEPAVARDPALTHALVVLSYLAGGPGIAVPLALLILAGSVTALRRAPLPAWTGCSEWQRSWSLCSPRAFSWAR